MASGRHLVTNEHIISHWELVACLVGIIGEDYIYFDLLGTPTLFEL
jgi:hypothetical protein